MSNTGWTSVGELADDAQDLAGRRLLLQGLGEVGVLGLELVEQPHVLHGDHGLVGEGLHQRDLVGERRGLGTAKADGAERHALAQQRDAQGRAVAVLPGQGTALWVVRTLGLQVGHMDGTRLEHRAAVHRNEGDAPVAHGAERDGTVPGDEEEPIAVTAEDAGVLGAAQARRALRQRVEHGLNIGRGARDHAQDLGGGRLLSRRREVWRCAPPPP